jgi:hypothetical protein
MTWEPRLPLTAAEKQVDFEAHNNHIVERRDIVERMALRSAKRIGFIVAEFPGLSPFSIQNQLQRTLERHLEATARFGYQQAQSEISRFRTPIKAKHEIPDSGDFGRYARYGLVGIALLITERTKRTAQDVTDSARSAVQSEPTKGLKVIVAIDAATRSLHNHVLELVGETLNMGRTAGALEAKGGPPEFALRSEQLDKNTCDSCTREHGQIYQVDSNDYYAHLPPSECYGGGRCRGIMVFGEGPQDVRLN